MVSINYSSREVCCKIVYYGPGLSGKTTNLQYVHAKVPQTTRGKLISLATEADRTLYFDFLPINIGTINGFSAKFQLYTVPGQVYYNATRKLVLRGVDGIVFVADSQPDKMDENIESLLNLEENLVEYGYDMADIPLVIQYNKRDLPNVLSVDELNAQLNKRGVPTFEAAAPSGVGVFDTLKLIIRLVLEKAKSTSVPRVAATVHAPQPEPAAIAPTAADSQPLRILQPTPAPVSTLPSYGDLPVTTQTAPVMDARPAEPVRAAAYRPYPGGRSAEGTGGISTAPPAPAAGTQSPLAMDSYSPVEKRSKAEEAPNASSTPTMAPSLRKRQEAKKRGFFKRLFGLK